MMDRRLLSRRAVVMAGPWIVGLTWAPHVGTAAEGTGDGQALRFSAIVVDASGVARLGGGALAAELERTVGREAHEIFADRLAPQDARAPQLVIRLESIQLASYAGGDRRPFPGDMSSTDYLEGAGVVTSGGRMLSRTPVLSALDASYSGAWYLPDIDARRIASIAHHFAYWLRREMGI